MKYFRYILYAGLILLLTYVAIGGFDRAIYGDREPPDEIQSLDDFIGWKGDHVRSFGYYEQDGERLMVVMTSPGRLLASGPSAYVFRGNELVDWTLDMGDYRTVKNKWDLTSGNVIDIREGSVLVENREFIIQQSNPAAPSENSP